MWKIKVEECHSGRSVFLSLGDWTADFVTRTSEEGFRNMYCLNRRFNGIEVMRLPTGFLV